MKVNHDLDCKCGLCAIFKMNLEVLPTNKTAKGERAKKKEKQ